VVPEPGQRVLPVGTVLRAGDPEPPVGTMLMWRTPINSELRILRYSSKKWSWPEFAQGTGPFVVVAPDYDKLVGERWSDARP
jgi:hypothetical protein